jgi:hypothetical protein
MELIHERAFFIKIFEIDKDRILVQGLLADERFYPSYIYSLRQIVEPCVLHRMKVSLKLLLPKLVIEYAEIQMPIVPNAMCRDIETLAPKLVGLQLTQGFKAKVKNILGGKIGCIHIRNMISFMESAAIQGSYTYYNRLREDGKVKHSDLDDSLLINSCHMWRDDGPLAPQLDDMKRAANRIRASKNNS